MDRSLVLPLLQFCTLSPNLLHNPTDKLLLLLDFLQFPRVLLQRYQEFLVVPRLLIQ